MNIRIIPFERLIEQDKNPRGVFAKKWEVCVECNSLEEAEKLKETLAQPEQKPVAFRNKQTGEFCTSGFLRGQLGQWTPLYEEHTIPLYITPPQRKPLTEREILDLLPDAQHGWTTAFYGKWVARAVERAHGIKGE